jgi:Uma2 family endonuclease
MLLLISCLQWYWRDRQDYFVAGNLTIYYSAKQKKSEHFRGPDFFVVLDTDPNPQRKSWVVWQEQGKYPNFILEILSDSTANTDRGLKKQIYQDIFRTPEYFWFDPDTEELKGFHLVDGFYQEIVPIEQKFWSEQLQLYIGVLDGKARFFNPDRELVLLPSESALLMERQILSLEERSAKLESQLRSLGIEPQG